MSADKLNEVLKQLGERHAGYGVVEEAQYAVVAKALLATLKAGLGEHYTPDVEKAWTDLYAAMQRTMLEGSSSEKGKERFAAYKAKQASGDAAPAAAGDAAPAAKKKSGNDLVAETWDRVKGDKEAVGKLFYKNLFSIAPELQTTLFKGVAVDKQAVLLVDMIDAAVELIRSSLPAAAAGTTPTKNPALMFIKPHALTDGVKALVETALRQRKIAVLKEGEVTSEDIAKNKTIDRHYATIARYAVEWSADKIALPEDVQGKFKEKFGVAWTDALKDGKVLNAAEASEKLGKLSPEDLSKKWAANSARMKLAPGLYVTKFDADGIWVINGFYLINREKFTAPGKKIRFYVVEWSEGDLTWKDFRALVVGPTDPTAAPRESLRGVIMHEWKQLGLAAEPTVSDNGIHASAGPLEGLVERHVWVGTEFAEDDFAAAAVAAGIPLALLETLATNPVTTIRSETAPVFDLLEDKQSSEVIELLKLVAHDAVEKGSDSSPRKKLADATHQARFVNLSEKPTDDELRGFFEEVYDTAKAGAAPAAPFRSDFARFGKKGQAVPEAEVTKAFDDHAKGASEVTFAAFAAIIRSVAHA